ncbi:MAG: hypothetical protein JWN08_3555 [Frankiales bacterium]|jgi:hypothetical protein|nr:hypothetical protein [Frankiales bacterium]
MLSQAGRRARTAATVVVAGLVLAGTFVGQDDDFPFGPFRMYSTRDDPNGTVVSTRVEAVDTGGTLRVVDERSTGLKRAEIEGQVRRFTADPTLLGALSRAHDRLRPEELPYEQVRVVERAYELRDSRPTGAQTERVVVRWVRP